MDLLEVRKLFPIINQHVNGYPLVYLDNAASAQKPIQVIEALKNIYEWDNANVHRGGHTLSSRATDAYEGQDPRWFDFFMQSRNGKSYLPAVQLQQSTLWKVVMHNQYARTGTKS